MAVDGATVLSLCEQGDKLLEEETAKIYKGKKISKGMVLIRDFPVPSAFDGVDRVLEDSGVCRSCLRSFHDWDRVFSPLYWVFWVLD